MLYDWAKLKKAGKITDNYYLPLTILVVIYLIPVLFGN